MDLAQACSRAVSLANSGERVIVGIVGPPGAGKSTVTASLMASIADAVAVPMDGFHLSNEVLTDLGRRERKGAPDTFDVAGYVALLNRLRGDAGTIYAPRFDRSLEESIGSAIPVPPECTLVITEGNYLLADDHGWSEVRTLLDEVWYLDVPREVLVSRLVARRMSDGHPEGEARTWVKDVDVPNMARVEATAARADRVLTTPDLEGER